MGVIYVTDPIEPSVIYREGPITDRDYSQAIIALQDAQRQLRLREQGHGNECCYVCADTGHTAEDCHHNPLVVARRVAWAEGAYRCWHCGFVARTHDEGREHFGPSDESPARCVEEDAARWRALAAAIPPARERAVQWPRDRADVVTSSAVRNDLTLLLSRVSRGAVLFIRRHNRNVAALVPTGLLPDGSAPVSAPVRDQP